MFRHMVCAHIGLVRLGDYEPFYRHEAAESASRCPQSQGEGEETTLLTEAEMEAVMLIASFGRRGLDLGACVGNGAR